MKKFMALSTNQMRYPALNTNKALIGELKLALKRLDRLLEKAISKADAIYGSPSADAFRGLYLDKEDMQTMLTREPFAPLLWTDYAKDQFLQESVDDSSRLAWLQKTYSLTGFDIDVILIALAPDLDLRYERLYAYLQDDVTKKRPTVDLVLNLLSPSAEAKLINRSSFESNAPLISNQILHLAPNPNQTQPPLLAHYLNLDDRLCAYC
jgi:hypothetical protein